MIEAEGLSKFYGSYQALDQLNFSIAKGEVVGFLGPNGAGKSTTMNILTGFLSLSEGHVRINGHDIFTEAREARECVGYLPEQPPLYLELTVREYLHHVCGLKKLARKSLRAELKRVLPLCGLGEVVDRKLAHLSRGFRQRVGLAQALLGEPPLLILDEPTAGLDPQQILEIRNLLRHLSKEHTILFSSHILSEIEAVCDRVLIIDQGRLVADGNTEDFRRNVESLHLEVLNPLNRVEDLLTEVLGEMDEFCCTSRTVAGERLFSLDLSLSGDSEEQMLKARKQLSQALNEKGFIIVAMQAHRRSLEDIFLSLTARHGGGLAARKEL